MITLYALFALSYHVMLFFSCMFINIGNYIDTMIENWAFICFSTMSSSSRSKKAFTKASMISVMDHTLHCTVWCKYVVHMNMKRQWLFFSFLATQIVLQKDYSPILRQQWVQLNPCFSVFERDFHTSQGALISSWPQFLN